MGGKRQRRTRDAGSGHRQRGLETGRGVLQSATVHLGISQRVSPVLQGRTHQHQAPGCVLAWTGSRGQCGSCFFRISFLFTADCCSAIWLRRVWAPVHLGVWAVSTLGFLWPTLL